MREMQRTKLLSELRMIEDCVDRIDAPWTTAGLTDSRLVYVQGQVEVILACSIDAIVQLKLLDASKSEGVEEGTLTGEEKDAILATLDEQLAAEAAADAPPPTAAASADAIRESAAKNLFGDPIPTTFEFLVCQELHYARKKHRNHASLHDSLSVVCRIFRDLQHEVMKRPERCDKLVLLLRFVQLSAMSERAAEDMGLFDSHGAELDAVRYAPKGGDS